jgi:hypothetical protein
MTGFLIVSPCRSGSTATAIAINEYCKTQNNNLAQHVLWYNSDIIHNFTKNHVHHTHQIYNIKIMPTDFTLIINHRDPFDSTISRIVAEKLDKWAYYNNETIETKNINFNIDIKKLIEAYNNLKIFNAALTNVASKVPHYEINYDDIKDDLNNVFKICNLNYEITSTSNIPTRVKLDYPNIIPNYGELLNYAITQGWRT